MLLGLTSSKMASPDAKDLRPPLNGDAVALWLSPERVQAVDPKHREVLLDWLTVEHARKSLSRPALDRLKKIALWRDQHDVLTAAEEWPLYLSVGHDVPPNLGAYRILSSGSQDQWRPLIRSLGVTELHLSVLIKAIVSEIERTTDESQISAGLRWLRDCASLAEIEATEGKETASAVRSLLRSRPIIASTDGRPRSMQDLYNPDAAEALEMLGPIACYPEPNIFEASKEERAKWLRWLDLDCAPRPDDVVARIDMLVVQAKSNGIAQVTEPLLRILQYLDDAERWKKLRVLRLHDKNQTLAQYLAALAWLPPIRDGAKRTLAAGFAAPGDELRRAADLVPVYLQHQVASQQPLLDARPHSQLSDDLGLQSKVPLRLVIAHLRRVRDLWNDTNHSGLELQRMQDMALDVLARIGHASPKETAAQDESLVESLRAEPCIWHPETQRFWLPSCVFLQQVPGFEPLRVHLIAADAQRKGLLRLGARESPMSADYLSFLRELAERHLGAPLPDSARRNVLWAWQRLSETEDEAAFRTAPPVLTRNGHLLSPSQVLEDDAPWWSSRLKLAELPFLAPDMPLTAARIAGVRSADREVRDILLAEGTSPDRAIVTLTADLQQRISCYTFQRGVLRLLSHARDLTDIHEASPHVDAALQLRLVPASTMQTALHCAALGRSEPFGEGESDSFLDGNRLLLALDDLEAAAHELAAVLNRRISESLRLQDLSGLEAIIRCQPEMIEEVLNRRRIRALPVEAPVMDLSDLDPTANAEAPPVSPASPASPVSPVSPAASPDPLHAPAGSTPPIVRPADVAFSGPGAPAAGPPLAPGDGTSHVPGQGLGQSHRGWMRSYASYAREGTLAHPLARASNADSNRAAIEFVIEDARSRGWRADSHPGLDVPFDVRIEVPGEDLPRVVVVRGLAGAWDRAGVPLSKTQLLLARENECWSDLLVVRPRTTLRASE